MPKNVGKIFLTEQTLPAPWGRSWLSKLKSWCLLLARSSSTDWYCLWSLQLHIHVHPLYMDTEIHSSSRWHTEIYAHDATATLPSITSLTDQQTPFEPCGWILRNKLAGPGGWERVWSCCGAFRRLSSLRSLSHIHVLPCKYILQQRASTECLAARWNTTLWHVGSSPPCPSFEGCLPHCSWTQRA